MKKLFYVAVTVIAALGFIAPATLASVPDPGNSTVAWQRLICGDTKALVCPGCNAKDPAWADTCRASWLFINVKDQFNAPMVGDYRQRHF